VTKIEHGWPSADPDEIDQWSSAIFMQPSPAPAVASEAEQKFALTLRRIAADAAVELLVDELEEGQDGS
jgi:hypothetical protein